MGTAERHIIRRFAVDAAVIGAHFGIPCPMAAFTAIGFQILPHRLPRRRPVIPRAVVTEIEIPPRLVKLVEHITQNPPVRARPGKAVAACVVGNQCAVLRRSKVIRPGRRGIRTGDYIFPRLVVKVSVLHGRSLPYISSIRMWLSVSGSAESVSRFRRTAPFSTGTRVMG